MARDGSVAVAPRPGLPAGGAPGAAIDRLVIYEAPFVVDGTPDANDPRMPERTKELVDAGRRGDAVRLFLRTVGMPSAMVPLMRLMPPWKKMTGIAHTLPSDLSIVIGHQQGRPLPAGYYDAVVPETLVMAGREEPCLHAERPGRHRHCCPARAAADPGWADNMVKPKVVAAAVAPFLAAPTA